MKHFVYSDTELINSYISQIYDGLLMKTVNESQDEIASTSVTSETDGSKQTLVDFGLKPFFNIRIGDNSDIEATTTTLSQLESGKELIEKIFHDNSLEHFMKYLNNENLSKDLSNCELSDYVTFNGKFTIIDMDHFLNVYNDDFVDFLVDRTLEEIHIPTTKNMNSNQKKIIKDKINTLTEEVKAPHQKIQRIFRMAKNIMPFSKFMICNNCIIPLNSKYLRESTSKIKFNYSSNIVILGKYTNTLLAATTDSYPLLPEMFSSIDDVLKALFIETFKLPEDMKIVIPIALYFE